MSYRRSLFAVVVALGIGLGVSACGSDEEPASESSEWAASEEVRTLLKVDTWRVAAAGDHTELLGIGNPTVATEAATLRVRAQIWRDKDGGYTLDFDYPLKWRMEYVRGELPVVSGSLPPAVAYALATSVLDAPRPAATEKKGGGLMVKSVLVPQAGDSLITGSGGECLVKGTSQLIAKTGQSYNPVGKPAVALVQQFKECNEGGLMPTSEAGTAACKEAMRKAADKGRGCTNDEIDDIFLGNAAADALTDWNNLGRPEGSAKGVADKEAAAKAAETGMCVYTDRVNCPGGTQEATAKLCNTNADTCKTVYGGEFIAGGAGCVMNVAMCR